MADRSAYIRIISYALKKVNVHSDILVNFDTETAFGKIKSAPLVKTRGTLFRKNLLVFSIYDIPKGSIRSLF